jgi:transcriptional regulator with XRE-family HTH domain
MKIQEKIRVLREARDWSQEEMATKLNMSTNGYAKIERGETKASFPKLEQIAEIFDVELMELLSYGEKHLYLISDNSNTGCNIIGSPELAYENQKLQLIVNHKDEIIDNQKQEITYLKEMIELLKTQVERTL